MSNYEQQDLFPTPKESTSLPALILVNRFPLQARNGAKKIRATSGQKFIDSLEMTGFVQCTFLEKTLVDILDSVSTPYQRTWSAVVTDGGVLVSKHRVSGRITEDKESGGSQKTRTMIPTATASDHIERESTSTETMNPMTGKSVSLDRFVKFWPTEEIQKSGKPQMWSTPTTQEIEHPNAELTHTGRRKSKDGKSSHSLGLADQARMWPTPDANIGNRGTQKEWQKIRKSGHQAQYSLNQAVRDQQKMWPTPTKQDAAKQRREGTTQKNNKTIKCRGQWESEPNVGRVANGVPNRVHRLKALGNAIVPQMAYYIGTALIKDFQYKNHNQYRSVKK